MDGNESRDEVEVDEKSGRAARKGPIYVVSHPREFRKPNYLMALATGMFCAFAVDAVLVFFTANCNLLTELRVFSRRDAGALSVDNGLQGQ